MNICVVIPVKPLAEAKMRMASILTATERANLTICMLKDMLFSIAQSKAHDTTLVVSRDQKVLQEAIRLGSNAIKEKGGGLNSAISQTAEICVSKGYEAILILLADIPLITPRDVDTLVEMACEEPVTVIAPSRREDGTNALLQKPPNIFPTKYGKNSFDIHIHIATVSGIPLKIFRSPTIALDIDTVEDLKFCEQATHTNTYKFFVESGISRRIQHRRFALTPLEEKNRCNIV
jgi:2-phospho-L-lactate guanylyltransferase